MHIQRSWGSAESLLLETSCGIPLDEIPALMDGLVVRSHVNAASVVMGLDRHGPVSLNTAPHSATWKRCPRPPAIVESLRVTFSALAAPGPKHACNGGGSNLRRLGLDLCKSASRADRVRLRSHGGPLTPALQRTRYSAFRPRSTGQTFLNRTRHRGVRFSGSGYEGADSLAGQHVEVLLVGVHAGATLACYLLEDAGRFERLDGFDRGGLADIEQLPEPTLRPSWLNRSRRCSAHTNLTAR